MSEGAGARFQFHLAGWYSVQELFELRRYWIVPSISYYGWSRSGYSRRSGYGTAACLIFYSWMGVTLGSEASYQLLSFVES
jgi:hypothetical protein